MKIGVTSDTHIPINYSTLPRQLLDRFKDCDLIIHAGDVVERQVLDELGKIAEVKAVHGNMDSHDLKSSNPSTMIIDICGKKIGVTHGYGSAAFVNQAVRETFRGQKLDVIIYGHSHETFNKKIDGTLYFNPGSPTDIMFTEDRTFGILEIDNDRISAEIIKIGA